MRSNAVWLDRGSSLDGGFRRRMQGHPAVVEGRFQSAERGHLAAYSGTLTDLNLIAPLETRQEFYRRYGRSGDEFWASERRDPRLWLLLLFALAVPAATAWLMLRKRPAR